MAGIQHLAKAGSSPKLHCAVSFLMQCLLLPEVFQAWLRAAGKHPQEDKEVMELGRNIPGGCCTIRIKVWAAALC